MILSILNLIASALNIYIAIKHVRQSSLLKKAHEINMDFASDNIRNAQINFKNAEKNKQICGDLISKWRELTGEVAPELTELDYDMRH